MIIHNNTSEQIRLGDLKTPREDWHDKTLILGGMEVFEIPELFRDLHIILDRSDDGTIFLGVDRVEP